MITPHTSKLDIILWHIYISSCYWEKEISYFTITRLIRPCFHDNRFNLIFNSSLFKTLNHLKWRMPVVMSLELYCVAINPFICSQCPHNKYLILIWLFLPTYRSAANRQSAFNPPLLTHQTKFVRIHLKIYENNNSFTDVRFSRFCLTGSEVCCETQ